MHNLAGIKKLYSKKYKGKKFKEHCGNTVALCCTGPRNNNLHVKDNPLDKPSYCSKMQKAKRTGDYKNNLFFKGRLVGD